VSALLFANGRLSGLRTAWQGGLFVPVVCRETTEELIRVLSYPKFHLESDDVNALLAEFLPYVETFALFGPLAAITGLTDTTDAVFVYLARQAKADWLISGDTHLLELKKNSLGVRVISPADFLGTLDIGLQLHSPGHG
jgi:predicted nucleic acid-binding protein